MDLVSSGIYKRSDVDLYRELAEEMNAPRALAKNDFCGLYKGWNSATERCEPINFPIPSGPRSNMHQMPRIVNHSSKTQRGLFPKWPGKCSGVERPAAPGGSGEPGGA